MRICRFNDNRIGIVEGDEVRDVTEVKGRLPQLGWPFPKGDLFIRQLGDLLPEMEHMAANAPSKPVNDVKLLSPVANPGKVIAAPVNYERHLEESRADQAINFGTHVRTIDEYGVFLKATSSVVGPCQGVVVDWHDRRTDHEMELALVIGRKGFRIPEADALGYIAGYMHGLDMTIRGTEDRSFRKSLDTFTVLGPWMVTPDEVTEPNALNFELAVNGVTRQRSNTRFLIFNVQKLIHYASQAYTLFPGDIVLTGTPEGVGPVFPGDTMHTWIDGIGEMQVRVRGDRAPEASTSTVSFGEGRDYNG